MVFHNVWLGPLFLSAYSIFAVLICLLLSFYHNHLPARWPFLSEIATKSPESNVYSLMVNHIALMVAFWAYLKHRELISYFSLEHQVTKRRLLSLFNMCIGVVGAVAMQMSVNFPKSKIPYIQTYASLILLVCIVIYVWIHTIFSFFVVDPNISRTKLLIVRACIAAAITSCAGNSKFYRESHIIHFPVIKVFEIRGHNFDKTTPSPLDSQPTGAIFEWGIYFSVCLFLLTDAYEFRNLSFSAPKLVIPGSESYDETRLLPPTDISRNRNMSFNDLPSSQLQASMVW